MAEEGGVDAQKVQCRIFPIVTNILNISNTIHVITVPFDSCPSPCLNHHNNVKCLMRTPLIKDVKTTNEAMVKNLTRENALIATAWYDLTSRLQSNHVVLQRRQDAPKSWLNKQRQMVSAMPRR